MLSRPLVAAPAVAVADLVPYDEIQIPSALYKQIFPRVEDHAAEADVAVAAVLEARAFTGKGEVGSRASNAIQRTPFLHFFVTSIYDEQMSFSGRFLLRCTVL
jgi:hypothetical protein